MIDDLKKEVKLHFYKRFELTVASNNFIGYSNLKKFDMFLDKIIDKVVREYDDEDIAEKLSVVCFLYILKDFNSKNEFKMIFLDNAIDRLINEIRVSNSLTIDDIDVFFYRITDTITMYYGINIIPNFKSFDIFYYYLLELNKDNEYMFNRHLDYMKPELENKTVFNEWLYLIYNNYSEDLLDLIETFRGDDKVFNENVIELPTGYSEIIIFENMEAKKNEMILGDMELFVKKYFKPEVMHKDIIKREIFGVLHLSLKTAINNYILFLSKDFEIEDEI